MPRKGCSCGVTRLLKSLEGIALLRCAIRTSLGISRGEVNMVVNRVHSDMILPVVK